MRTAHTLIERSLQSLRLAPPEVGLPPSRISVDAQRSLRQSNCGDSSLGGGLGLGLLKTFVFNLSLGNDALLLVGGGDDV